MIRIFKNLINTLKQFKTATVFNILGLSVAFAAFVIIMMQVKFENNFDKCHSTHENVFRVSCTSEGIFGVIISRPFAEAIIQSSPHIKAGTILLPFLGRSYFSITENGVKKGFRHEVVTCSPALTRVFDIPILSGDKDCLTRPENAIIPESLAKTLFGNEIALGKSLHLEDALWTKDQKDFIVGGVYKDFPENTQLKNAIYTAIDPEYSMNQWFSSNFICYLLLDDSGESQNVTDNFNTHFDFSKLKYRKDISGIENISLISLADIYFKNESQDGRIIQSGNRDTVNLILFIAILVVVIAAINFMNFNTSLAPLRIKTINTQKILGCSINILRLSLIVEAVIVCFISYLLSILYIVLLENNTALSFISQGISISNNIDIVLGCGGIAVLVGILAGLYPAYYTTSFSPALALKGTFGLSPVGKRLRTILVSFQFIISIGLIIVASFISLQNDYLRTYSIGFDKDQIAIVELNNKLYENHKDYYVSQLKSNASIEDAAFAMEKLGASDMYSNEGGTYKDAPINFMMLPVSWNFFDVMGIPIIEGRKPTLADESSGKSTFLFSRSAQEKYEIEVGTQLGYRNNNIPEIVGITDDVKFTSLRSGNNNIAFAISSGHSRNVSYVRIKAGSDYRAVVEHIHKTVASIDPAYPVQVEFYDSLFNQLYHKENTLQTMITVFCILAILISIVGVFSLVIFETEYRRKEIGIRKVLGSTVEEVLFLFNKMYIYIICICFVIAVPIAYYFVSKWLNGFAYQTPIHWWVFAASGLVVLLFTMLIVSVQSWRAARANPVDSIKNE